MSHILRPAPPSGLVPDLVGLVGIVSLVALVAPFGPSKG